MVLTKVVAKIASQSMFKTKYTTNKGNFSIHEMFDSWSVKVLVQISWDLSRFPTKKKRPGEKESFDGFFNASFGW